MHIITGHNLLKRSKKSGDRPNPNLSGKTLQVKRPEKYQKKKACDGYLPTSFLVEQFGKCSPVLFGSKQAMQNNQRR